MAAFQSHQATESAYHCHLLVRTLYTPATHNLNQLRPLNEDIEPSLRDVFPGENRFQKRSYNRLREAYVKARYSRHYQITPEELAWLSERIALLHERVRAACLARIEALSADR